MRLDMATFARRRRLSTLIGIFVVAPSLSAAVTTVPLPYARAPTPTPTLALAPSPQPITLIVAQGPGSGSDITSRLVAQYLGDELGQPVIVDNKSGAGGIVGHEAALRSREGNTFVFSSTAPMFVIPHLNKAARYRYKDFTPVASVMRTAFVVLVPNTDTAPRTLRELIAGLRAEERAYSSAGYGTMTHLVSEMLLHSAGIKAVHVPYKGSGASLNDLIGGRVAFASDSLAAATPFLQSGQLRALAVTGSVRQQELPQVPTLQQSGYDHLVMMSTAGLFAPKGGSPESIDRVAAAMDRVMQNPELLRRLRSLGTEPLMVPRDVFAQMMKDEEARWDEVLQRLDLAD